MTRKDILKITFNLVAIYLAGGLILAVVYAKTSPIMYRNAVLQKQKALRLLMPDAERIDKLGEWTIHDKRAEYYIAKKGASVIGYIIQSFGKGYSSYIDVLIAVNPDFTVRQINIIGHAETPGLGDEIEKESFKNQFAGKAPDSLMVMKVETSENIQAISGATISSRAVAEDAVKSGVDFLMKTMKGEGAG